MSKYKVFLYDRIGFKEYPCAYEPEGLEGIRMTQELFINPQNIFGYKPKYSELSLRFVLEDREFLLDLVNKYGVKSHCNIDIELNGSTIFHGNLDFKNGVRWDDSFFEISIISNSFYDIFLKRLNNKATFKYDELDDVTCKKGAIPIISKVNVNFSEVWGDYNENRGGYASSYNVNNLSINSRLSFIEGERMYKFGIYLQNGVNDRRYFNMKSFILKGEWYNLFYNYQTDLTLNCDIRGRMVGFDSNGNASLINDNLIIHELAVDPVFIGMRANHFEFDNISYEIPNYTGADRYKDIYYFIYFQIYTYEGASGAPILGAYTDYNTMEGTAEFTVFESSGALDVNKEITFKGLKISKLLDYCFGSGSWVNPNLNPNQYITSSGVISQNGDLSIDVRSALTNYLILEGSYLKFNKGNRREIGYISDFMSDFEGIRALTYTNYLISQFNEDLSVGSILVGQKPISSEYTRPYDDVNQQRTFIQSEAILGESGAGELDLTYNYLLTDWYLFIEQFKKNVDVSKNESDDKIFFVDTEIDENQVNNLNTYGLTGLTYIIGNTNYTPRQVLNKWITHINRLFAMYGGNRIIMTDNEGNKFNFVCNGVDESADIVVPDNVNFYKIIEIDAVVDPGIDFARSLVEFEHRGVNYVGAALSATTTDDLTSQKIQVLI
jgi:hypothetical protein